jgi:hypothetical protein
LYVYFLHHCFTHLPLSCADDLTLAARLLAVTLLSLPAVGERDLSNGEVGCSDAAIVVAAKKDDGDERSAAAAAAATETGSALEATEEKELTDFFCPLNELVRRSLGEK